MPNRNLKNTNHFSLTCIVLTIFLSFSCAEKPQESLRPDWVKDLVIYEVAIKGFTSPDGPESGTFRSLQDKMVYLEELGINAIWLTGHSSADPKHFYGIWTQYACIEPDKLDPALGSEQDFKDMINEAHRRGIKIFLDTIEHGVMSDSPLIKKHPEWFKEGTWGMTDYDWGGSHADLDEWWVDMWTKAVLDWGVDGFRCDCGLHRPDLWLEIKRRCAAAGKPIFILGESGVETVSDACQRDIMLFNQTNGRLDSHSVLNDLVSVKDLFFESYENDKNFFRCQVTYEDDSIVLETGRGGPLQVTFLGPGSEDIIGTWEREPDGMVDWNWQIKGVDKDRSVKNVLIDCQGRSWTWRLAGSGWQLAVSVTENGLKASGGDPLPGPKFRVITPSCHDCGWEGFPEGKNAYMVQGSRFVFGYGVLFAPAIPIFMGGEEFDADYRALPGLTPDLYGKGKAGTGRWLYGSWLQWDQLKEKRHQDMLTDVKRMLVIRREHQDLIHAVSPGDAHIKLTSVSVQSGHKLPVPYAISNGKRALIVVGNPSGQNIDLKLNIAITDLNLPPATEVVKVTELWPAEQTARTMTVAELSDYSCTVPADLNSGGGLCVIRLEPVH